MSAQLYTYVEMRLNRWAVWYHLGEDPRPRRVISQWGPCVLDRNVAQQSAHRSAKVDPAEASETDKCVDVLARELREAVHEVYLKGGTIEQKARFLGIRPRALFYRLERANRNLLGYMNDVAAGIALPQPDRDIKNNLTSLHKKQRILATVA